jgi:hypothetical protein
MYKTNLFRSTAFTVLIAGALTAPQSGFAQVGIDHLNQEKIEFTFDVSEDMNKYVEHRVAAGEEPVRGSQFVTEGAIFPPGTIPGKGEEFDPNMPGARGAWFCKGVFLVRGSEFDKSPQAVLSEQIYLLPSDRHSITTSGTEGNGTAIRAVTGGTGAFTGYSGEQRQQFLGFNKTGGVNLRVTITLHKTSR